MKWKIGNVEIKNQIKDIQIRNQDIQNRAYDLLWQQKTIRHQRDIMFWQSYKLPGENLTDAKLRFFHSLPSASGDDRKAQLLMVALLKIIHDTCRNNEISYWLDFGTLLGAVRHSGFIPKHSSRTPSLIWSQSLSGWPSPTDSEVNR